jgi:predicted RNase H-like HicB family nuclease
MTQAFNVIIEKDADGYFVASVPSLKGCHTQAKSYGELIKRIQEAIELCLEMEKEEFEPLEFIGVERVSIKR